MSHTRSRVAGLLLLLAVFLSACAGNMRDQAKVEPYESSEFFGDGLGSRQPVENTVARGQLRADTLLNTGMGADGQPSTVMPYPVTIEMLEAGRTRFETFCSPCHDRTGSGNGMIVRRGYRPPPSFHQDRLREAPVGHFFDVITNGFGAMPSYAAQVPVEDRWAIVAYIRALQLSQNAQVEDLPADLRQQLESGATPEAGTDEGEQHGGGEE